MKWLNTQIKNCKYAYENSTFTQLKMRILSSAKDDVQVSNLQKSMQYTNQNSDLLQHNLVLLFIGLMC